MGRLGYLAQPSGSWSWYFRQNTLQVARQVWRAFCRPGANFIACRRGRGTILVNGRVFLPVDNARKRHWRSVAMQVVSEAENCHGAECLLRAAVRIRVPGYVLVLVSGSVYAKSMTNNLPLLSVL